MKLLKFLLVPLFFIMMMGFVSAESCPIFEYSDGLCHKSESMLSLDCEVDGSNRLDYNKPCPNNACTSAIASLGLCDLTDSWIYPEPEQESAPIVIVDSTPPYTYGDGICHKDEPRLSLDCVNNPRAEFNDVDLSQDIVCTTFMQSLGMCDPQSETNLLACDEECTATYDRIAFKTKINGYWNNLTAFVLSFNPFLFFIIVGWGFALWRRSTVLIGLMLWFTGVYMVYHFVLSPLVDKAFWWKFW